MDDDERDEMIKGTHDTVTTLKTVLLGVNSDPGLIGEFKEVKASHYKLRQRFYLLIGVLGGSGLLTGAGFGIAEIVKVISG